MMPLIATAEHKAKDERTLIYFDYFRAIAILLIIMSHCYNTWHVDQLWEAALVNIISGNTALFVFASGFFFHYVYFPKFSYIRFLTKKTLFVFLPYLILSLLFMAYYYLSHGEIVMATYLNEYFGTTLSNTWLILINLLTGRTQWAYWYIPFAMLLFLSSPVFIRFIQLALIPKLLITIALFILAMFLQRPLMEINPFHSLIYFLPYYLLGIIYSMEHSKINTWFTGKVLILFALTVAVAIMMYLLGQTNNAGKASILAWHGPDYMILQKLSLILFILAFTMHCQQYNIPILKTIANMSFALYFLHQWILSFMRDFGVGSIQHGFGGVLMIFIAATIFSYLLACFIKQIFKSKSRYVIGW
jgi:probable poly-beta-1,6-N-acetyl-D-glucosamine export protein